MSPSPLRLAPGRTAATQSLLLSDPDEGADRLELVLYAIHQRLELPALQPAEALP